MTVGDAVRRIVRERSIRFRATAAAVAIMALVAGAGAVLFVVVMHQSLTDGVRSATAEAVSVYVDRVGLEGDLAVESQDDDDVLLQLQDDDGRVLAHGDDAGDPPLPTDDGSIVRRDDHRWVVVSDDIDGLDGETLVAAGSLDDADAAARSATWLLLVTVPLLVALIGGLTWVAVGRALRPVDRMRADAESIGEASSTARIAEPAGGDEITRLAGTLNSMLTRMAAAHVAQRRFVSDASHELRSPLAAMRQHAEVAQLHPDRTSIPELAEVVIDEVARQQGLVDALLVLARLDEGGALRKTIVDVDDIALAEAARLRGSEVRVVTAGVGPARLHAEETLIRTLVHNLVDNAARHAASMVHIATSEAASRVTIVVGDDGSGVPPADRERVFDRFVRLDEGRDRASGGSGLGLAIVAAIASAHGGAVSIGDGQVGGAAVTVVFPSPT